MRVSGPVLAAHGVPAEAAPVGAGWYLRLPGGQTVSLAPAYRPVSRRFRPEPSTLLRPEHGLVPFLGRQAGAGSDHRLVPGPARHGRCCW